jgi:ATP-dependent Lon protease
MNETEHTPPQSADALKPVLNAEAASSKRPASDASAQLELPDGALILLPTRNAVLFPGIVVPLTLGREQSIAGAQAAAQGDRPVGVLLQSDASADMPGPEHLHRVGTVAEILRYVTAPDGTHHLVARGSRRFRVLEFLPGHPFLLAKVEEIGEAEVYSTEIAARTHQLKERAREAISLLPNVPQEVAGAIDQLQSPSSLADFIANVSDLAPAEKQDLLETFDVGTRLDKLLRYLAQQIEVLRLSKQIGEQTQESLSGRQREHILREQLRQIQKELGEGEDGQAEIAELREAVAKAAMPEEAEKQALKELKRLERMPEASAEHGMV